MKPGREHFYQGLKQAAQSIATRLVQYQWDHDTFLAERTIAYQSRAYARATSGARVEFDAYLRGVCDMLHTTRLVVFKHWHAGQWVDSPLPWNISYSDIDPNQSRHVWASSNKVWFGGTP